MQKIKKDDSNIKYLEMFWFCFSVVVFYGIVIVILKFFLMSCFQQFYFVCLKIQPTYDVPPCFVRCSFTSTQISLNQIIRTVYFFNNIIKQSLFLYFHKTLIICFCVLGCKIFGSDCTPTYCHCPVSRLIISRVLGII